MTPDPRKSQHLIVGLSAASSLKIAFQLSNDQLLINEDPIWFGPAPASGDLNEWQKTREQYLATLYPEYADLLDSPYKPGVLPMRIDHLDAGSPLMVWLTHGIPEHLTLCWLAFLLDQHDIDWRNLYLIHIDDSRSSWPIRTMGELQPEKIPKLAATPRRISAQTFDAYLGGWRAYTSSNPHQLLKYLSDTTSSPKLYACMRRFLYRYPCIQSGLSLCDEFILKHTAEKGPRVLRIVGHTMGYEDSEDRYSDSYVFQRLLNLGRLDLDLPLIKISGDVGDMRGSKAEITPFGNKVLAKQTNCVEQNGIDDWIGGVHLSSPGPITYRKNNQLIVDAHHAC